MREQIRDCVKAVLAAKGEELPDGDDTVLRDIGFASLDFAEATIRFEEQIGRELNFDAASIRAVHTVGDLLDMIEAMARG